MYKAINTQERDTQNTPKIKRNLQRVLLFFLCLFGLCTSKPIMCETVYGLMITGKDAYHEKLARRSIDSFLAQTYREKHLIIVNDGPYSFHDIKSDDITEIRVEKGNTLGELRNISLDAVPEGCVWVQWDDDDWHHPEVVQAQYDRLLETKATAVLLHSQVQYSQKKHAAWMNAARHGIMGTILSRKVNDVRYPSLKKSEDAHFIHEMRQKYKVAVLWNPPEYYLRFVHGYNTWDEGHFKLKTRLRNTFRIPKEAKQYLKEILYTKYQFFFRE